jgi:hypothetical protein
MNEDTKVDMSACRKSDRLETGTHAVVNVK